MAIRINIPKWLPKYERWQIKVRKDGVRRTFTSPVPVEKDSVNAKRKPMIGLKVGLLTRQ